MFKGRRRLLTRAWFTIIFSALIIAANLAPASASVCTLADHIRSANTNTAVGFCPAGTSHDIITITQDITLDEALPPITGTITIEGGGHTISGAFEFRIFDVQGGNLTIKNLTLTKASATRGSGGFPYIINDERVNMDAGGAIRIGRGAEVRIENTALSRNLAEVGGAIALLGGKLSVNNSSFERNNSFNHDGGAIFMRQGALTITRSSFIKNKSALGGGAIGAQSGSISVSNSSFEDNVGANGGVLYIGQGEATLTHLTMVNNRAKADGNGNVISKWRASVRLRNSVIGSSGYGEDCVGGLKQNSGNWSEDGTCGFRESSRPLLGKLTGSPAYRPLLDGSPLIDGADPNFCLETDQLGTPRPQGGGCDIGAIESATAIAAPVAIPDLCTLPEQLVAANFDKPVGACPAGNGADTIFLVRDFTLRERLPAITSKITIWGNGFTISGDGKFRIFDVDGGELALHDVTLTKGRSTSYGGAIVVENGGKASIDNSQFISNTAKDGGAVATGYPNRGLTINNSEFRNNQAQESDGGAIYANTGVIAISGSSFVGNTANSNGGAIAMQNYVIVSVSNSSFVNNAARYGGAISTPNAGKVDIRNSIFLDNRADLGGAVSTGSGDEVTLAHVTMLGNHARDGGGIGIWLYEDEPSTVSLHNSIVAGNRGGDCSGRLTQSVGNLIQDGSCSPKLRGDPLMEEAEESAIMVAPSAGSPAIDAADPQFCLPTDQIGNARPQGAGCDIGAIEMPAPPSEGSSASVESPPRSDCQVTTTHALNFPDNPNGKRIGLVPPGTTLVAMARTQDWFSVEYRGTAGWISAHYVTMQGVCG